MKKIGRVFQEFRQSVTVQSKADTIEETLQSENFQLAKVGVCVYIMVSFSGVFLQTSDLYKYLKIERPKYISSPIAAVLWAQTQSLC